MKHGLCVFFQTNPSTTLNHYALNIIWAYHELNLQLVYWYHSNHITLLWSHWRQGDCLIPGACMIHNM